MFRWTWQAYRAILIFFIQVLGLYFGLFHLLLIALVERLFSVDVALSLVVFVLEIELQVLDSLILVYTLLGQVFNLLAQLNDFNLLLLVYDEQRLIF